MGNVGLKRPSFCGTSVGDLRSIFKDERALVRGWQCTMHAHIGKPLVKVKGGTWGGWEKEVPWLGWGVISPTGSGAVGGGSF